MKPTEVVSLAPSKPDPKAQPAEVGSKRSAEMSFKSVKFCNYSDGVFGLQFSFGIPLETHSEIVHDAAKCDASARQPHEALEWILSNQILPIVDEQLQIHVV